MNYTRWLVSIVVITAKPRYAITYNYDGTFNIAARCKLKQRVRQSLNQYQSVEYALICVCDIGRQEATGAIFDRKSESYFAITSQFGSFM